MARDDAGEHSGEPTRRGLAARGSGSSDAGTPALGSPAPGSPDARSSVPRSSVRGTGSTPDDRFRALVEHSFDLVSIYNPETLFTYASPSHEQLLGRSPADLLGTSPLDLLHPDEVDRVASAFADQLLGGSDPVPIEHRVLHADGSWRWVESVAKNLTDDPAISGVLVNAREVTDRRRAEELATEQAGILELIARGRSLDDVLVEIVHMVESWMDDSTGLIMATDHEAGELRTIASPHLGSTLRAALDGYPIAAAEQFPSNFMVASLDVNPAHPETGRALMHLGFRSWWGAKIIDSERTLLLGAVVVLRKDHAPPTGPDRTLLQAAANLASIAITRNRAQVLLARQATHDALTGLPNRQHVLDRLHRIVQKPRVGGAHTAVLFLDIDRFKILNDSVGHEAGDLLLIAMGKRLNDALRPGDLVARFGGDEFVMVCEQIGSEFDAYALANRILDEVQAPFDINGHEVVVTASIGIAMVDRAAPQELLRDADAAMYWAKERGRARAEMFDEELRERVVARLTAEQDLRQAIEDQSFSLVYQPIISFVTDQLVGFEALLRWHHPERGLLAPGEFLQVAEECGLIRPIGAWVRGEALRQAARWRDEHPEWGQLIMGMNLAPGELRDRELTSSITRAIADLDLDPTLLSFEVTERLVEEDPDLAVSVLTKLRNLGVQLALDDFGTGTAALSDLKNLPVNVLKIDRSIVSGIGRDPYDDILVDGTVDLTRRLGLFCVAEGVEQPVQEERLRAIGCFMAQGNRFAPPLTVAEVESMLGTDSGPFPLASVMERSSA
jgi:diguanylate cyclase (GGDEF)-like protein/PAS domain S-box-containing protein